MADQYMVFVPGSTAPPLGPFGLEELYSGILAKRFPADAKANRVGDTAWVPITEVISRSIQPEPVVAASAAPAKAEAAKGFVPVQLAVPTKAAAIFVPVQLPVPGREKEKPDSPGTPLARPAEAKVESIEKSIIDPKLLDAPQASVEPEPIPEVDELFEVTVDGETFVGPVTDGQLRRGIEAGKLPSYAMVRRPGTTRWRSIADALGPAANSEVRTAPTASAKQEPAARVAPEAKAWLSGTRKEVAVGVAIVLAAFVLAGTIVMARKQANSNPKDVAFASALPSGSAAVPPVPKEAAAPSQGRAPEMLARGLVNPFSLAVDNDRLFVAVYGAPVSKEESVGTVVSLPADGGDVRVVASGQKFPSMLQQDHDVLFWITLDRKIWRLPVAGGKATVIHRESSSGVTLVGIDEKEVYFAKNVSVPPPNGEGGLFAMPRSGGNVRTIYEGPAIFQWALGSSELFACQAAVSYLPKKGESEGVVLERGMGAEGSASGPCLVATADGSRVFWYQSGSIEGGIKAREFATPGSRTSVLARERADRLLLEGDYVYWFNQERGGKGRIARIKKSGGAVEAIADALDEVTEFYVASPYVYWTSQKAGMVSRLLLPGASPPDKPKPKAKPTPTFYPYCRAGTVAIGRGECDGCYGDEGEVSSLPGPKAGCTKARLGLDDCRWKCEMSLSAE